MAQIEQVQTKTSAGQWVYLFEQGTAEQRDLLGGKGAGLSGMARVGLPVPPGFTITTEACNAYNAAGREFPDGLWEQTLAALGTIEERTGKGFGNSANPLLVSVRSGARISYAVFCLKKKKLCLTETTL